jgi:DNA invertase Pin-like site-specific DNA recombinase
MSAIPRQSPTDEQVIAHYYTRVSSDEQAEDGLSHEQQPERCLGYIGRQPTWVAGEHFQDVLSGRKDNRHEYQRMLLTIRGIALTGQPQALVVPAFDRLGRNVEERVRAYKELQALGVPLHGIRETGVVPELIYNILASVAQEETRLLSVRVREINDGLAAHGWHTVGSVAWGYRWRPSTEAEKGAGAPKSVLEPHPLEAPYVREAFERYAAGESVRGVARWVAGLPAEVRGDRNMNYGVVHKLLRAPVYVARPGGADLKAADPAAVLERPVGRWEQLVTDETWRRAARQAVSARRMPKQASGSYPLTGLLRCFRCGSRMSGRARPVPGRPARREYVCHASLTLGAALAGQGCYATVGAEVIEARVLGTVREVLEVAARPRTRERVAKALAAREQAEATAGGRDRLPVLEAARQKARKRIAGASKLLIDGVLDREAYDITRAELSAELMALDAEIERLRQTTARVEPISLDALLRGVSGWADAIERADPAALREALGVLLEYVEPVKLGRGVYEARPVWTGVGRRLFWAAVELSGSENLVAVDTRGNTRM